VNSAALKWVCNNPSVTTSVPGIANYEHLRLDLAIGRDPSYTDEEKRLLSDNRVKLGLEFCRQCRKCLATCPRGVDIPTLMRGHMYARQYADFERSRRAIDSITSGRGMAACASCDDCTARCANSVRIARKIDDLKLLYG
jgi:predicted aldo/keto reductase-like oxidoreductase